MKNAILLLSMLTFVLILAACGGSAPDVDTVQAGNTERAFSMPPEMALMIGTVKLDETEYAIDAEQAAEFLPLWKALRSLSESETAATAEVEAIINQINDTMTSEQLDAIAAMELTIDDFSDLSAALGIESFGFGGGNMDPEMQATMQAARESGEEPPQGFGRGQGFGGGQGPGGGEVDPAARETAIAERGGSRGANLALNTTLLEAIIEFLEAKSQ